MDRQDQHAIDELFRKIDDFERQSGPRDSEAEAYIRSLLAQNPSAAYYMAQTIVVQEQALNAAQRRIEELESQPAPSRSGGGLLGSLFGGGSGRVPNTGSRRMSQDSGQPWGQPRAMGMGGGMGMGRGMGGGGFLAGAAQTAMGVAGGVVLGSMLSDMLSPDEAAAAGIGDNAGAGDDVSAADGAADENVDVADAGSDFGGDDFGGGDFGDFG